MEKPFQKTNMLLPLADVEERPRLPERQGLLKLTGDLEEGQNLKRCRKCNKTKDLKEFYQVSGYRNGIKSICKKCECERVNLYRGKYRNQINIQKKVHYHKNIEAQRAKDRKRYREYPGRRNGILKNHKKWSANNPRLKRDTILKRTYGISIEQYEALSLKQNGLCAICGGVEKLVRQGSVCSLVVDHCHETNQIRGLLCNNCNRVLGLFKDKTSVLKKAIEYLDKFKTELSFE